MHASELPLFAAPSVRAKRVFTALVAGRKTEDNEARNTCWETSTLDNEIGFPVAEVATAAAVSSSTTFFVAVVCCCCFPSLCKKKEEAKEGEGKTKKKEATEREKVSKDENDNENEDQLVQPKLRAHLSRRRQRHHNDTMSRTSASPVRDQYCKTFFVKPRTLSSLFNLQTFSVTQIRNWDDSVKDCLSMST